MEESDRKQHARAMIEECDRVTARINQFLAFARPCEPAPAQVDVRKVVEELAMILEPDMSMKNLSLDYHDVPARSQIRADRELFRQAMFNLIQNAVQFAPEGDAITVALHSDNGSGYRIDVADRGPGVPDEAVRSLFTPYYTTRADGTGLGLAIVRRIAGAHGWQAAYHARSNGGAVFSLEGIHG
jgi:signal transduction histidine kinase